MQTFRTFSSEQQARDYRYEHGTGGWIFVPDAGEVTLFPPEMPPAQIMNHPMTRGQSGRLIGSM